VLGCLSRTKRGALLAGLAMAAVILIRPNLTPLAAVFGVWLLVLDRRTPNWPRRIIRSVMFGLGAGTGVVFLASFNASLYEGPAASGYGSLEGFFSVSHILPNLSHYPLWLAASQTPLALVGLAALVMPARWFGKRQGIDDASLLVLLAAGVAALYLLYTPYGAWWYLRFFLPAWPAVAIGTAWLCADAGGRGYRRWGLAALLVVGAWGLEYARRNDAFRVGWGDLRYVSAAHIVRDLTAPGSVILSMQHSGSVTYYGGRRSMRYDWIEPYRLESTIEWLRARGHDVYILLDEGEVDAFRARFRGMPYGALAEETLMVQQEVGTRVLLYDTRSHVGEMRRRINEFVPSARRCATPHPLTGSRP
jgi:hypothetical protein